MSDQTRNQVLDGLLLGDAYIPREQSLLYFSQCQRHREYVEYVAQQLSLPVDRVRDRARKPDKRTGKIYLCSELRTLAHREYAELRQRWYRDGRKVVPTDLQASRPLVLHWFLCDGACSVNRNSGQLLLCTDAFTQEELEFLQELLRSVEIESSIVCGRRIRIRQRSLSRFFDYIGESPVECLKYKWIPAESRRSRQQHLRPHYEEIRRLYLQEQWSCQRIAERFNTNYFSIRYVLKSHFGISFGKKLTAETTCREGVVAPSETTRRAFAGCE
jgi:hypothetical protein